VFAIASSHASVGVKAGVFNDSFEGLILYVSDKNEKTNQMSNIFITDERSTTEPATIFAHRGLFISNEAEKKLTLRLFDGTIHSLSRGPKQTYQLANFATYDLNLDAEQARQDLADRSRSLSEYTSFELLAEARRIGEPSRLKRIWSDLHRRNSLSFAPFFFALIGIPLGLQASRSGKGSGFTLALSTALFYYLLLKIAANLVSEDLLPVSIAFYLPNLVFLAAGSYAIYRCAVERPLRLRLPACFCRWSRTK
jgi:lipopolysaccharide export system permease protein